MGTELALLFVVQTTLLTAVARALETPARVAPASSKRLASHRVETR